MADQYPKEHSAVKPARIKVIDTLYADGMATVTYTYCWGITGDDIAGYDYYTREIATKFKVAGTEITAIRNAIRAEYQKFVSQWDAGAAERATVEGWIDYIILD